MKMLTLFSGIGAPEQAAVRVWKKVKVVAACEIDKFARKSYQAMYDPCPEHFHSDVHDMDAFQYGGEVDLLVGGSPCQSFSVAGLRRGMEDERGQLIYQYLRVVKEVKPKAFIYENVKGFKHIDKGESFEQFCESLSSIGYHIKHQILNTRHYGVPQNRERIFIVGFRKKKHCGRFTFPEPVELEKRLKDILEEEVDEKFYLSEKAVNYMNRRRADGRTGWDFKQHYDASNDYGSAVTANIYKGIPMGVCITQRGRGFNKGGAHSVAPTLTKNSWEHNNSLLSESILRRLTPKECWRLQDFPDWAVYKCQAAGVSNTQLYKQAGNSMSVNVIEALMRQIKRSIK